MMPVWASGMHGGLRASGPKADIALIVAEDGAAAAGAFTTNIMCAAPVTYCRQMLARSSRSKAVSHSHITHSNCASSHPLTSGKQGDLHQTWA